ncbi:MAG TPA: D-amino-acid transaminase [Rhodospirillales bacterium]|nr:D-amino-acid transaminase [Rhodospirillales bacterium]
MTRIAYVNGRYVPHRSAAVHIEDRGYQFSDGVYEVIAVHRGQLIDEDGHLVRLQRSLDELQIAWPIARRTLGFILRQVVRRNHVQDGIVYLQITRGVAPRNHAFPAHHDSALVITARPGPPFDPDQARRGVKVITIAETRWKRRDIKTVSLLGNCLGKEQAVRAGAYEAWFVDDDGLVTEGTSSNAWIVAADGVLRTRQVSNDILNGITRISVLKIATDLGLEFAEQPFTVAEAKAAKEAFVTSTTSFVKAVVQIDDDVVADGEPGPLAAKLLDHYGRHMNRQLPEAS